LFLFFPLSSGRNLKENPVVSSFQLTSPGVCSEDRWGQRMWGRAYVALMGACLQLDIVSASPPPPLSVPRGDQLNHNPCFCNSFFYTTEYEASSVNCTA
jgi:hypothetical protein